MTQTFIINSETNISTIPRIDNVSIKHSKLATVSVNHH